MKRRWTTLILALALTLGATGCSSSALRAVAGAALVGAAVAHTVAAVHVIRHHDAHHHHGRCGHRRRRYQGRYVYRYEGRWEYYDGSSGRWYRYAD